MFWAAPQGSGQSLMLYENTSSGGSGNWVTSSGYGYSFEFCGGANQTARVAGTLYFYTPLI